VLDGDAEFDDDELLGVEDLLQPATLKTTAIARAMKPVRMIGSCAVCGEVFRPTVKSPTF
jgi:hypothetical protein